jgi:hypothetical protein
VLIALNYSEFNPKQAARNVGELMTVFFVVGQRASLVRLHKRALSDPWCSGRIIVVHSVSMQCVPHLATPATFPFQSTLLLNEIRLPTKFQLAHERSGGEGFSGVAIPNRTVMYRYKVDQNTQCSVPTPDRRDHSNFSVFCPCIYY